MALPPRQLHDEPPSLRTCCIDVLAQCRHALGDLGHIDADAARQILAGASSWQQLAAIEDATRQGSNHDLTWYTWQIWHRLYLQTYGPVPVEAAPPLPGHQPPDYTPPVYNHQPAHYRALFESKAALVAARMARASGVLRSGYRAAEAEAGKKRMVLTDKLPPPKRVKQVPPTPGSRALSSSGRTTLAGQSRAKVLGDLLGSSKSRMGNRLGSSNSSSGSRGAPRPMPKPLAALVGNRAGGAHDSLAAAGARAGAAPSHNSSSPSGGLVRGTPPGSRPLSAAGPGLGGAAASGKPPGSSSVLQRAVGGPSKGSGVARLLDKPTLLGGAGGKRDPAVAAGSRQGGGLAGARGAAQQQQQQQGKGKGLSQLLDRPVKL